MLYGCGCVSCSMKLIVLFHCRNYFITYFFFLNKKTFNISIREKMSSDKSQCVNDRLSKDLKEQDNINVVAIDCEMVGTRSGSILARVSIVNSKGETICDKFVKPTGKVINYRTCVSGIRPRDIENGEAFAKVRQEVVKILKNKILVGHGLKHDSEVLQISHPEHMIRDTSLHWKVKESSKLRTPSLKFLAKRLLGVTIQEGEHSSVEDAKATGVLERKKKLGI